MHMMSALPFFFFFIRIFVKKVRGSFRSPTTYNNIMCSGAFSPLPFVDMKMDWDNLGQFISSRKNTKCFEFRWDYDGTIGRLNWERFTKDSPTTFRKIDRSYAFSELLVNVAKSPMHPFGKCPLSIEMRRGQGASGQSGSTLSIRSEASWRIYKCQWTEHHQSLQWHRQSNFDGSPKQW